MKAFIWTLVGCAALVSFSANADHRHHRHYYQPFVSFGYTYGFPRYNPHHHWHYRPYPSYLLGLRFDARPRYRVYRSHSAPRVAPPARLYVYPAAGQSEEQTGQDRYECHVWSADQSGYDPTLGGGTAEQADGYNRAFTACMEGRNYVVK